jgi:hypothetical protein
VVVIAIRASAEVTGYLDALAKGGLYGKSRATVTTNLVLQGIRDAIRDRLMDRPDATPAPRRITERPARDGGKVTPRRAGRGRR